MLPEFSSKFPELRQKLVKPFVININPNVISVIALIVAIVAGYLFWQGFLFLAAVFVLLNGFLDILDGEIAKTFKRESKFGDFIDHSFDRIADVAILLGLTLNKSVPDFLGFATIILVLLVSYLGTEAQALTSHRLYSGLLGRGDRLLILAIIAILGIWFAQALYYGILLILVLSGISFLQRFVVISKILRK
ncbi:TPA: CDP-alcohol phosphatidyltransferase family protein [archaeon]|nr:CDP-alcohol phosphatidyltransferase family protein [Candidatus Naiadarchaeales archaeon SRR2090153.bin1042]